MKRGLFGYLIGAVMLAAACAGSVMADPRPPRVSVDVKPRMASSAKPATHSAADQEAAQGVVEARVDTDDFVAPVWQSLVTPQTQSRSPLRERTPLRGVMGDEPASASQAAWESPVEELGLPNSDPVEDAPAIMPPADAQALEADVRTLASIVDLPVVDPPHASNIPAVNLGWDTDLAELRTRINDLEQDRQLRNLTERVREVEDVVDVTDQPWVHTWGGRIQADMVYWPDDIEFGGHPNYVEFRRLRFFCAGEGYGVWNYKLEFDLTPEVNRTADVVGGRVDLDDFGLEVKDAYLGIIDLPWLGYLRAGHFKVPFSLEELTSSKYLTFMERGLPQVFVPGREFGIAAYRYFPGADMTLAYGAFYDDFSETAHNIENDNQGFRTGFRWTWAPWYDECTDGRYVMHTGASYLYTRDSDNRVRFRSRPEIHRANRVVDTGDLDANQLQQVGTELAWVHGPLSLQSEFIYTQVNDTPGGTTNLWGVYAYASYFLTGEHRPYNREEGVFGRVMPYENFWCVATPHGCATGRGAWEMAFRYSYLDFRDIGEQQLHDLTAGLNWYWNPYSRLMVNWVHPMRHDDLSGLAQGDVVGVRFEVDF